VVGARGTHVRRAHAGGGVGALRLAGRAVEPPSYRRAIPRYFSDRRDLLGILRRAIDTMFCGAAEDAGKFTWVKPIYDRWLAGRPRST
jgi:hypothetical protein